MSSKTDQKQQRVEEEEGKIKKSTIYTRTGDKGSTVLFSGIRRSKDDQVFQTLGTVDELNANLGMAAEHCLQSPNDLHDKILTIQSRMIDLGTCVATPVTETKSERKLHRAVFKDEHVTQLERWIDELDSQLPPLKNFILPSGGLSSTQLHISRTVCRRAERCVVPLVSDGQVPEVAQRYLNRLSDLLFVMARYAAHCEKREENPYCKPRE